MARETVRVAGTAGVRRDARRGLLLGLIWALVVALLLGVAYALGYRVNLQTGSVAVPTAEATPEEVVLAYAAAYNHRDFATLRTIYPSASERLSRFRAMGTMDDVRIVGSRAATDAEVGGTSPEPGYGHARVEVSVDLEGLTGSDLAYASGPNGWTYVLERVDANHPWTITDQGNG